MAAQVWSYGVTTVPERFGDLLPRTLASLERGGFDRPRLFVDGCEPGTLPERFRAYPASYRWPRVRTFGNWVLALWELYLYEPQATRYAVFQDDLVCYRNLRGYLDRAPFPGGTYLNLYTWPRNQAGVPAGSRDGFHPAVERGKGALALVFTRDGVRDLLRQQHMVDRPIDPIRGHRQVDGGIWNAMVKAGYKELIHSPSLVQHLGLKSTMTTPGDNHDNQALAPGWKGEDYDALAMLPAPVPTTPEARARWEEEKLNLERAIREDVVRMDRAAPHEKTRFRNHIERYKQELIRHEASRPD